MKVEKLSADLDDLTNLLGIVLGESGRKLFYLGMFGAVFTSLLGNGLGLGYLASHAFNRWKKKSENSRSIDYKSHPVYKITAIMDYGISYDMDIHWKR